MVHVYIMNATIWDFLQSWLQIKENAHGIHFQRCLAAVNAMCKWLGLGIEGTFKERAMHEKEEDKKPRGEPSWHFWRPDESW